MPKIILNATADEVTDHIVKILNASSDPYLVLPGGSSPIEIIKKLSKTALFWDKIQITTTDERCVPTEHEHSNIGQIIRLFKAQKIKAHPLQSKPKLPERTTITILGMGEDGHFASLFPNDNWEEREEDIINATAPSSPKDRISLSMERLMKTENLFLLVNNQNKWDLCQQTLNGGLPNLPIAKLLEKTQDNLTIYKMF